MGFGDILGKMFSGLSGGEDGAHQRIWGDLKPWLANLGPAATRKWLPRIASGDLCEVPIMRRGHKEGDCQNFGIAVCDVCKKPVCLQHSRIDQFGDAICYTCVAEAVQVLPAMQRERARNGSAPPPRQQQARQQRQEPPPQPKHGPSPEQVMAALGVLGLKPGAKFEAVKAAHRKISALNHPDKHKTKKAKDAAHARFVEVQKAFEVLKTVMGERAA
jgi:DnaJ domain